jgi:lambda family phage portal protein
MDYRRTLHALKETASRLGQFAQIAAVYGGIFSDAAVGVVFPGWGAKRMQARASFQVVQKMLLAGPLSPYNAAKWNRLSHYWRPWNLNENAVPAIDLEVLAARSRDLYRNNKHARKIVRQIVTKTVGTGMRPQSTAVDEDGKPQNEFRARAQKLWQGVQDQLDYRGGPGYGGQTMAAMARMQLKTVILNGHCLTAKRPLARSEQKRRNLTIPLLLQPIDPARLDTQLLQTEDNRRILRGVEFNADGTRGAYWIFPYHPADPLWFGTRMEAKRVPAAEIIHTYDSDDVDQVTGVSWFCAALDAVKDTGDYEYNELKSAAMSACVALMVTRPQGVQKMGLATPTEDTDVDDNGNSISRMQPGMFFDKGVGGDLKGFDPLRPADGAEAFIKHLLNTTAGSLPGIKGTTLTGDYRGSSFASERSADNEIWPEIEVVQQFWGDEFYQPIYEAVVVMGVLSGYFDDVISPQQFAAQRENLLRCSWQGPVIRSINPVDDANAASLRIRNASSSPQIEAGLIGRNWHDILRDLKEFVDYVNTLGLDPTIARQIVLQSIGIGSDVDKLPSTQPDAAAEPPTAGAGKNPGLNQGPKKPAKARGLIADGDDSDEEGEEEPVGEFPRTNGHGTNGHGLAVAGARF